MRVDIMTDIETLGHKTDSTIIQLSAIAFNIETGEYYDEFNSIVDVTKDDTINVTGSTLKWWLNTNKELLTNLINQGADSYNSTEEVLGFFHRWIKNFGNENVYLWGNGILFDNKMIQYQMESQGLDYPIFYRNDRDVRTLVDLASKKLGITEKELKEKFNDENLTAHNALDDVKYQINLVVGCYKILTT